MISEGEESHLESSLIEAGANWQTEDPVIEAFSPREILHL
jgi:hypothetical protein